MIDSHVHLNRPEFAADRADVLERAEAAGVRLFLEVGYDLESSVAAVALAERDARCVAAVGVHPHDATLIAGEDGRPTASGRDILARLRELARHPRVVAVGEIGLDFYRDLSPRPAQRRALLDQLSLAAETDRPVIFHTRDAYPELTELLDREGVPTAGAVLHAFAGDAAALAWARRRGLLVGIGGPVTYKNAALPDVLAEASLDDILLETDAPWLPPVPHRGQRNEPALLAHTRDRLAALFDVSADEVERRTDRNFARLFGESGD
jgi:TatD DNase family protein